MAILDKIFKRREDEKKKVEQVSETPKMESVEEVVAKKMPLFLPEISMFELENADWSEFAARLKANKILPNSYVKKPANVQVALDKKNEPMVLLTFVSETSDSVREILLRQDRVSQSIKGVVNGKDNDQILEVWLDFQDDLRRKHSRELRQDAVEIKKQGEKLKAKAERMIALEDLLELERVFLEKYQNAFLDDFCCLRIHSYIPVFGVWDKDKQCFFEWITPFSPKTLELCLRRLSESEKIVQGYCIDLYDENCEKIKNLSGYESKDWDKVIGYGRKMMLDAWAKHEAQDESDKAISLSQ